MERQKEHRAVHADNARVYRHLGVPCDTAASCVSDLKVRLSQIGTWFVRQDMTCDVLAFWDLLKNNDPEIYELAMIILAAPASQVSVERAFSCLSLILTPRRTRLATSLVSAYVMISMNRNVFKYRL